MDVTVRFVPRSKSEAPRKEFMTGVRSRGIEPLTPDRRKVAPAVRELSNFGVNALPTLRDRLEAEMTAAQFQEKFKVQLVSRNAPSNAKTDAMKGSYLTPKQEVPVPTELQDTIEFAYVPTPVSFYASSVIPPIEDIYHLSVDDVRLALNASACHRRGWTGAGVKVAMADTGFELHPWFLRNGYKLVPTHSPGSGNPAIDEVGHGTGEAANIFAVAPDCTVFGVKHGNTTASTLEACIEQQPDIMTHSWGWSVDTQSKAQLKVDDPNFFNELIDVETVILEAIAKGICVFFSGGNGHFSFPACIKEVIAVGGTTVLQDMSLEASNYASSFVSKLYPDRRVPDFCGIVGKSGNPPLAAHIMLPVPANCELDGENFPSGRRGLGWGIFSGTSAASPQAAGAAALLKGISKKLTPEAVRSILTQTCVDVDKGKSSMGDVASAGLDLATGAGFMDVFAACQNAATTS
jgi:serine protease AprX